jgi:hypothetical protein
MKKMLVTALSAIALLTACTVGRINSLQPGMTIEDVKATMGTPEQVQFVDGKMVLKYEVTKGLEAKVPYYLVFNKDTRQLESWFVNDAEYAQNKNQNTAAWMNLSNTLQQQQMLQQQLNTPQTINLNIRRY